jgi:hypothetical protein
MLAISSAVKCASSPPHAQRAFVGTGAGKAGRHRVYHFAAEPGDVTMPADNRQRRTGCDDARAGNDALCRRAAQDKGGFPR